MYILSYEYGNASMAELYDIFNSVKDALPNETIIAIPDFCSLRKTSLENLICLRDDINKIIEEKA